MTLRNKIIVACGVLATFVAAAATMGDQHPAAKYGRVQCPGDAGVAAIPLLSNQNAIAVRNFIGDGGTAATVYIGFDTSLTVANGFPVKDQETLAIDVVAITQNASVAAPTNIDGGTTTTVGSLRPAIYCTSTVGGAQDLRYIEVK